jgi:transcriptional regulator with XRE-family HTH domain
MDNICKQFGENVRKYRLLNGYSQEKLAEITGLHRTYISDVERGKRSISLENIRKISVALNIEEYKLFIFSKKGDYNGE